MRRSGVLAKHLFVVPRSAVVEPSFSVPKTRGEFMNEVGLLYSGKKILNQTLIFRGEELVGEMNADEVFALVRMMKRFPSFKSSELRSKIIDRVVLLGIHFSMSQLIAVNRYFDKCVRIERVIADALTMETADGLKPSELISLLHVVDKSKSDLVVSHFVRRLKSCSVYEIASFMNELKKLGRSGGTLSPAESRFIDLASSHLIQLFSSTGEKKKKATKRDLALIANALASFGPPKCNSALFKAIIDRVTKEEKKTAFDPLSTALLLHAVCRADLMTLPENHRLFDFFAPQIENNISLFRNNGKIVGLILYAFGKLELVYPPLIKTLASLVTRELHAYEFQTLALSVYGFSRLGCRDSVLWNQVKQEIIYRGTLGRHKRALMPKSAADVAMIVRGVAAYTKKSEEAGISHVVGMFLKKETEIDAVSFCEALAVLAPQIPHLWVSQNLTRLLPLMSGKQLCSVLNSLVCLGFKNKFFEAQILVQVGKTADTDLRIKLVSKLAKLGLYDHRVISDTAKIISSNLPSLTLEQLVHALFAMSEMAHRDETFNAKLVQALSHQLKATDALIIGPLLLSKLVLAACRLRAADEHFMETLARKIFQLADQIKSEQIACNILFALSASIGSGDWTDSANWFPCLVRSLLGNLPVEISVQGIRQLQILHLTVRMKKTNLDDPLSEELLLKISAIDTFKTAAPSIEQSSGAHREISRYLTKLGLSHRNETTIGPFSLDIFDPISRTVIEIDGPNHFYRESTLRTSSSVLKRKIISFLGFHVLHVPFQEWIQLTSEEKRLAYCSQLVQEVHSLSARVS